MIRAIIFDMDGLLIDSEPVYAEAYSHAFAVFGHTLTREEFYDYWTSGGGSVEKYVKERGLDLDPEKVREEKRKWYENNHAKLLKPMKGAKECVERMDGFAMAICSVSRREEVLKALRIIGIENKFDVIIVNEDVEKRKPDPEGFLVAAKRLGFPPRECVVIEDAEKGVIAGNVAGMKVIAVPSEYTKDKDFSKADLVLESLDRLTPERVRELSRPG
ncbi:MAG: HAD family phosphatase [Candidatus Aenigmarchaeota archaeon]|nr:HAD family phosphatase [Candidatus Aenigmarchaeota archaeon]